MTTHTFDRTILETPVRVIPLGHLSHDDRGYFVSVGGNPGGQLRGVRIPAQHRSFYEAQTPARRAAPDPTSDAAQLLLDMANAGILAPLPENVPLEDLSLIPVLRSELEVIEDLGEDGVRVRASDKEFTLPTLATLFLPHVDGHRTLAEIGELVRQQISRDAGAEFLANAAEELHSTPDELLASAALTLASEMRPAGAATFEWAD